MEPDMFRTVHVRLAVCATLCTFLTLSLAATGHAMPPQRVELTFEINFGAMQLGQGRDVLVHDGKHYQVVSETIPKGLAALFVKDIRRESHGTITDSGLRPDSFREQGRKQGIRAAEFNWSESTLQLFNGDTNTVVALPPNTIDQASLPYGFSFAEGVPDSVAIHVTDGRKLSDYRYRIVGRERVATVLGEFDAIHVEKVRKPDDTRSFEFWLAVQQYYLPIKMRFVEKGRAFDSIVTAINYP
jgi:hypothetical protein